MKFVELKVEGANIVFVNPAKVMTVEAASSTAKTSKLHFGGGSTLTVVGRAIDVAALLDGGLE